MQRYIEPWIVRKIVRRCLEEDLAFGDVTTQGCVPRDAWGEAWVVSKQAPFVVAGLDVCAEVFRTLDPAVVVDGCVDEGAVYTSLQDLDQTREKKNQNKNDEEKDEKKKDGPSLQPVAGVFSGPVVALCRVRGRLGAILQAERSALNLLARMCGVATEAWHLRQCMGPASAATLLDTRKTTPGLKVLEKYASCVGGAQNHRLCLADGVLIKENHIAAAGGIETAVGRVKTQAPVSLKIEVEVSSLWELEQALAAGVDVVLLDNMSPAELVQCVCRVQKEPRQVLTEASGNITRSNIAAIAATGVDYVSTSAMLHAVPIDLSLRVVTTPKASIPVRC